MRSHFFPKQKSSNKGNKSNEGSPSKGGKKSPTKKKGNKLEGTSYTNQYAAELGMDNGMETSSTSDESGEVEIVEGKKVK